MLSYRISERVNRIKTEKVSSYEILQNNYINDVPLALTAISFYKDNLGKISTIEELIDKLKELKGQKYINTKRKIYSQP
jgi:hypothetical protein